MSDKLNNIKNFPCLYLVHVDAFSILLYKQALPTCEQTTISTTRLKLYSCVALENKE